MVGKLINKEQRAPCSLFLKKLGLKMIIGFTYKTSKILPKIFCRKFRHCAVILKCDYNYLMLGPGARFIQLKKRDIMILKHHGWVFLEVFTNCNTITYKSSITCVSFAKYVLGIRAPFVWTPYQLYKKIKKRAVPA